MSADELAGVVEQQFPQPRKARHSRSKSKPTRPAAVATAEVTTTPTLVAVEVAQVESTAEEFVDWSDLDTLDPIDVDAASDTGDDDASTPSILEEVESLFDDFDLPELIVETDPVEVTQDFEESTNPDPEPVAAGLSEMVQRAQTLRDGWQSEDQAVAVAEPEATRAHLATTPQPDQQIMTRLEERLVELDQTLRQVIEPVASSHSIAQVQEALTELQTRSVAATNKRDMLTASIHRLDEQMEQLRLHVSTANKATLASAQSMQNISDRVIAAARPVDTTTTHPTPRKATNSDPQAGNTLLLVVSMLAITWSLAFYYKTQNLPLTITGLVIANVAGCVAWLRRRES